MRRRCGWISGSLLAMSVRAASHLGLIGVLVALGCSEPVEPGGSGSTSTTAGSADDTTGGPPSTACAEPIDISAAPQTLAEAVQFIDALPRPVSLDCVLEKLERPMALNATFSTVSLQPAVGPRSPRVFLFYGDLILSVAVDGDGRQLLEFGEMVSETQSVKGELEFPLEGSVTVADATGRILDEVTGTKCRLCHGREDPSDLYPDAFVSDALRFREDIERVPLVDVEAEYEACDPQAEPERCARLDALFAFGPVIDGEFPEPLQTIYDYE